MAGLLAGCGTATRSQSHANHTGPLLTANDLPGSWIATSGAMVPSPFEDGCVADVWRQFPPPSSPPNVTLARTAPTADAAFVAEYVLPYPDRTASDAIRAFRAAVPSCNEGIPTNTPVQAERLVDLPGVTNATATYQPTVPVTVTEPKGLPQPGGQWVVLRAVPGHGVLYLTVTGGSPAEVSQIVRAATARVDRTA